MPFHLERGSRTHNSITATGRRTIMQCVPEGVRRCKLAFDNDTVQHITEAVGWEWPIPQGLACLSLSLGFVATTALEFCMRGGIGLRRFKLDLEGCWLADCSLRSLVTAVVQMAPSLIGLHLNLIQTDLDDSALLVLSEHGLAACTTLDDLTLLLSSNAITDDGLMVAVESLPRTIRRLTLDVGNNPEVHVVDLARLPNVQELELHLSQLSIERAILPVGLHRLRPGHRTDPGVRPPDWTSGAPLCSARCCFPVGLVTCQ